MSDGGAQALVLIGRAIAPVIGPVIRVAVRAFFRTTFGLGLLGLGVMAANWYWAAQVARSTAGLRWQRPCSCSLSADACSQ
jgi:hypothetical protein